MPTAVKTEASELAAELVRAAFSLKGVMNQKRTVQYADLIGDSRRPLTDVLRDLTNLERIDGSVETKGKMLRSWSIIQSIANMCASYVWHTLAFANRNLSRKETPNFSSFFRTFPGQERKLEIAVGLAEALYDLDQRWHVLLPDHVSRLASEIRTLYMRKIPRSLRGLDISAWGRSADR